MSKFKIKLIKSAFLNEEETRQQLAEFILKTNQFSMSAECRKFEESFAHKQGRKHAVYVNSGSSANLVLVQALLNLGRLKKGDRVGISTITWSTNVMALIQLGLEPVAIDCELSSLNISPVKLEEHIGKLDALFLTNVLGFSDDIIGIKKLCFENDVIFFEDNCESLGSKVDNTLLGNFGLASTFSFFLGHHISTLEGGMVCTDDEELYNMIAMTRAHGWDRCLTENHKDDLRKTHNIDPFYSIYTFYDLAFNIRPTEINGFIGNRQLGYWDEIVEKRDQNFKELNEVMQSNDDFISFDTKHMDIISNFAIPILCKDKKTFQQYKNKFQEARVEIRPIIAGNISNQPFYKKYIDDDTVHENANFIHENGFYCGNNPEQTNEEILYIADLLGK